MIINSITKTQNSLLSQTLFTGRQRTHDFFWETQADARTALAHWGAAVSVGKPRGALRKVLGGLLDACLLQAPAYAPVKRALVTQHLKRVPGLTHTCYLSR